MADHAGRNCDIFGTVATPSRKVDRRFVTIVNEDGTPAVDPTNGEEIINRQLDTSERGWKRYCAGGHPPVPSKRRAEAVPA